MHRLRKGSRDHVEHFTYTVPSISDPVSPLLTMVALNFTSCSPPLPPHWDPPLTHSLLAEKLQVRDNVMADTALAQQLHRGKDE